MMNDYRKFDVVHLELVRGVHLIEAGAGTGKTYAITMLLLRAVVELGIPLERILIVTFTSAATEELKERVRNRLAEAKALLEGGSPGEPDETLAGWLAGVKEVKTARERLQLALYDIDRASIHTIHGFCQRMLTEQALESGQLFDVELLTDIDHIREQVTQDFWRGKVYSLDALSCSLLLKKFADPGTLLASVSLAGKPTGRIEPVAEPIENAVARLKNCRDNLLPWWQRHQNTLRECFDQALAGKAFKKSVSGDFPVWFDAVASFIEGRNNHPPEQLKFLCRKWLCDELNGNKFRGSAKKNEFLGAWELPDQLVEEFLSAISNFMLSVRVALAEKLSTEVRTRLSRQGAMGFDDLISRLSDGLKDENKGQLLRKQLASRYDAALIDEFQDTDRKQYHIFSTLFGQGHYLFLIGDPKQAIYRFRGADIQSYFAAREQTAHLFTLEKNYRSHPALVAEVNRLFTSRENPFRYSDDILSYHPVTAAKTDDFVLRGNGSKVGMRYCCLETNTQSRDGLWSSGAASEVFCRFVVKEIVQLLMGVEEVQIVEKNQNRKLLARDIAVLVRSNRQAEEYRQALTAVSIPVVLTSRQSVFQTEQCRDMLLLLQAVYNPGEQRALKTGMSITWFGLTGNELHQIWQDEQELNQWRQRFVAYRSTWQEKGFLSMMESLLRTELVLPKLAAQPLAERVVSNIYHLVELVRKKEVEDNTGIGRLIVWLQEKQEEGRKEDGTELLLESDEDGIQIVTMHSAKGLEYPVLFCPFLWYSVNRLDREKNQVAAYDQRGPVLDLGSQEFDSLKKLAISEQEAEDLRLCYVALTRAKLSCYVMWANVKGAGSVQSSFASALGYLLFNGQTTGFEDQEVYFNSLSGEKGVGYQLISTDIKKTVPPDLPAIQPGLQNGCVLSRNLYTSCQLTSYSGLSSLGDYVHERFDTGGEQDDEAQARIPVTGLPGGAIFGNLVHDLLEEQEFSRFAVAGATLPAIESKCRRYGVDCQVESMENLLCNTVTTLLPGGFSLDELQPDRCLKEMAFYFQLSHFSTLAINSLLVVDPAYVPLSSQEIEGYLTGFVDLFCEHEGRFYILDYKTNNLGDHLEPYRGDNLQKAMQSHNYGLQYWLYSLVLHRHLSNLYPEYDYRYHFGGVMYLFVRGMSPGPDDCGVYFSLPDYDRLLELEKIMAGYEGGTGADR